MFTSACRPLQAARVPLLCALGCAGAAAVYQYFGHGVTSPAMEVCFLPPLGVALCRALWSRFGQGPFPQAAGRWLGAGAATLSAGLFLTGIMEIAGTASPYPLWLCLLGGFEAAAGLGLLPLQSRKENGYDHQL